MKFNRRMLLLYQILNFYLGIETIALGDIGFVNSFDTAFLVITYDA